MKSEAASNNKGDEMTSDGKVEDAERTDVDKHSRQVDQKSESFEQTDLLLEEKLPEEPLNDQKRHLLYEKGIK